jgi:hypothetical protein
VFIFIGAPYLAPALRRLMCNGFAASQDKVPQTADIAAWRVDSDRSVGFGVFAKQCGGSTLDLSGLDSVTHCGTSSWTQAFLAKAWSPLVRQPFAWWWSHLSADV